MNENKLNVTLPEMHKVTIEPIEPIMKLRDVFKMFQPSNTDVVDYIIIWAALYDYHHEARYFPEIKLNSDCTPEVILSEKVLNARVIEMSAEDQDSVLIRIEEII